MTTLRVLKLVALTASFWTCLPQAASSPAEAEALLSQILAAKAKISDIKAEQYRETAGINAKKDAAGECLSLLNRPPMSEAKIAQLESNLVEAKARVISLEQLVDSAKITAPDARAAKKKELEQLQAQLRDDAKAAALPFEERVKNAHKPIEALGDDWAAALGNYFKTPSTGPFAGLTKTEVRWSIHDTGQLSWKDTSGKQVCWLSIFLMEQPAKPSAKQKTVDGKYPMNINDVTNIWVTCGNLKLALNINKIEWQTSEAMAVDILKALVDLDGLHSLSPKPTP
ncbi:MAG TPA: hypothetical protein VK985_12605 [Rariglobus sp.]|nr:hypothetical protein [Rariglobus sp.]